MMKNTEWGAVAYLSQSKYGKNSEIDVNNNETTYYTGGGSTNTYKTNVGQSTTGNITGVYDMSGNSYDYVMGVIEDNTKTKTPMSGNSLTNYHYSGFMGKAYDGTTWTSITGITFPYKKYYNLYEYGTTSND